MSEDIRGEAEREWNTHRLPVSTEAEKQAYIQGYCDHHLKAVETMTVYRQLADRLGKSIAFKEDGPIAKWYKERGLKVPPDAGK